MKDEIIVVHFKLLCCLNISEVIDVVFEHARLFIQFPVLYDLCHRRELHVEDLMTSELMRDYFYQEN